MRWARNIVGVVAVGLLVLWAAAVFRMLSISNACTILTIGRDASCLQVCDPDVTGRRPVSMGFDKNRGPWWRAPAFTSYGFGWAVVVPHWFTNLIAWTAFIVLWRKTRRHPEGHCQACGYDLRENVSGTCPECGVAHGRNGGCDETARIE